MKDLLSWARVSPTKELHASSVVATVNTIAEPVCDAVTTPAVSSSPFRYDGLHPESRIEYPVKNVPL